MARKTLDALALGVVVMHRILDMQKLYPVKEGAKIERGDMVSLDDSGHAYAVGKVVVEIPAHQVVDRGVELEGDIENFPYNYLRGVYSVPCGHSEQPPKLQGDLCPCGCGKVYDKPKPQEKLSFLARIARRVGF